MPDNEDGHSFSPSFEGRKEHNGKALPTRAQFGVVTLPDMLAPDEEGGASSRRASKFVVVPDSSSMGFFDNQPQPANTSQPSSSMAAFSDMMSRPPAPQPMQRQPTSSLAAFSDMMNKPDEPAAPQPVSSLAAFGQMQDEGARRQDERDAEEARMSKTLMGALNDAKPPGEKSPGEKSASDVGAGKRKSVGFNAPGGERPSLTHANTTALTVGRPAGPSRTASSQSFDGSFGSGLNNKSRMLRSQHTVSNLLAFAGGGTPVNKEEFRHEVQVVRTRLRNISRRTIDPRSRFVKVWDLLMVLALLMTTFITPFEVAFFEATAVYNGPINFTINRLVDAVFVGDILISFFMPYRATARKGGMMVYDNKKICLAYLRGWFPIDLLTAIPWDIIFTVGLSSEAGNQNLFRLLKMLRILKLARVVRASRIIARWQDHISLSFAFLSLLQFSALTCVLAHWLACLWGYLGFPVEEHDPWTSYSDELTWRQKARIPNSASEWEMYGVSLYVALNNIFGGSCEVNPGNFQEFYVQAVMLLIGSSVWAYVIGSACGIIATLDPARIEYRQTLDELNYFCRDQNIPQELSVKLRSYFRNTIYLIRSKRYEHLLQKMSTRLRGDAAYRMCEFRLRSVPFLVHPDLEPEFMCNLAIKYRTSVYSRLERVPCTDLFVVERGVVAKRGILGVAGACFGKDVILSNDNLRDIGDAIALTFVQTISLTQSDIFELLPDYPQAYHIVRKSALRMALIRALVKAAAIVKRSRQNDVDGGITGIFDKAMEEATQAAEARKAEKEGNKQPIPLSFTGIARLAKSSSSVTTKLTSGGLKKKGWGGLAAKIGSGGAQPGSPNARGGSPTQASPGSGIRLDNLIEKEKATKPVTVEDQLEALAGRVETTHKQAADGQKQVISKIGGLESALLAGVKAVSAKLDAISSNTPSATPTIRQKQRGPGTRQRTFPASPSRQPSAARVQEVQEMRSEADAANATKSTPYEA